MKKIFLIILFVLLTSPSFAQYGMIAYTEASNANANIRKTQAEVKNLSKDIDEIKEKINDLQKQMEKILELLEKNNEKKE